jgi:ribosomal protein S18 acetylase RimI-like enzyme
VDLTVQHANTRAVILYQKMGFKIVREQVRGTPDDPYGFDMEPEYYMEQKMS